MSTVDEGLRDQVRDRYARPGRTRPGPAPATWSSSRGTSIRPPGESTRNICASTAGLSTDRLITQLEITTSTAASGSGGISDVVAEDQLTAADRAERGTYVGCIAGALSRTEYLDGLAAVGFVDADVTFTHEAAPGMHAAIVRATKPISTG